MKIALAQINPTVGDFENNIQKIVAYTQKAITRDADLVVFPELALSGYPLRDLVERHGFLEANAAALTKLTVALEGLPIAIIVGSITTGKTPGKKPYNSAVFIRNSKIEFIQSKILLPTYDVFDEHRNFTSADLQRVMTFKGERLGITICEDIWNSHKYWNDHRQLDPYRLDPVTELVRQGADVIINISASPWHMGKLSQRYELAKDIALDHEVSLVYCNTVGGNDHLVFDGNSFACSRTSQIVAQAKSFEEDIVFFDSGKCNGTFSDYGQTSEMAELNKALVLGTRDYLRKTGFKKVAIGLSGGIDSALTAAIAVQAIGGENVTGILMPSGYSSDHSVKDAKELASKLGVPTFTHPIQSMLDAYRNTAREIYCNGEKHFYEGLTEENLQARIRGNILMAYSNKTGCLVLGTGNKSELAVGYCTLYGDMASGLAVISDVPKTKVYELAKWINANFKQCIPVNTITKPPSAELAPGQKDIDSLPPYDVLDTILEAYVEDTLTPVEIAEINEIPLETVLKVVRMVERNEYKRAQAPVGLKVTRKAFGVGRRLPIARKF